jgi:uncharacterized protein (DUF4415 family)
MQNMNNTWVDPDDAPELDDDFFAAADLYDGKKLVRRGRPKSDAAKVALTVRYSPDVVEYFRSTGEGWQTRMNEVLKNYVNVNRVTHS